MDFSYACYLHLFLQHGTWQMDGHSVRTEVLSFSSELEKLRKTIHSKGIPQLILLYKRNFLLY